MNLEERKIALLARHLFPPSVYSLDLRFEHGWTNVYVYERRNWSRKAVHMWRTADPGRGALHELRYVRCLVDLGERGSIGGDIREVDSLM